jgi:sulfite exporter TauE/SafE
MNDPGYLSAFAIGLAGAGHCLGMCGGIAAALNLGGHRSLPVTLAYHSGRIGSYTLLGGMLGLAAGSIDIAAWTIALRYIAGALLIAMGLYIADWWRGLQALVRRWYQGFALGLCWGLMPCGLIYSSLAWAATAQNPLDSAALMLCFGLGTLPAMLATSLGADRLQIFLRRRGLKVVIALLLIASGVWTIYLVAAHSGHAAHGGHALEQSAEPPAVDHSHHHQH